MPSLARPLTLAFLLVVVVWASADDLNAPPPGVRKVEAPGLENVFALTDRIYSGSSPETEEAFRTLAAMGIKTIITVDGARPNVELARSFGLRYIHLPHGYDGIPKDTAARLVKAAETVQGPIYMHCHHGKHRGPAAAAVVCESIAGWSPQGAENWLRVAGTAPDYVGLYRSVRENQPPTKEQLDRISTEFPETAEVSALVDTMVEIDQRWDRLKDLMETVDRPPNDTAASEAILLWEQFREAQRLSDSTRHGQKFISKLESGEKAAQALVQALKVNVTGDSAPNPIGDLRKTISALGQSCIDCHREYRDPDQARRRLP